MTKFLQRFFIQSKRCVGNENGWAIMSSMIAIFVGLIMMAGIFGLVQITLSNSKVQKAQNNITTIRSSIQQLFAGQPDYSGLTADLARQAGTFPPEMVTSSNDVKNAWNGAVSLSTGSSTTNFEIQYDDVPQDACIKLAPFGYGTWESVKVGGTSISQSGGGGVSDAVSACSGDSNSIVFEGE